MLTQYLSPEHLIEELQSTQSPVIKSLHCNDFGTDELTIPFIYSRSNDSDSDIVLKSKTVLSTSSNVAITSGDTSLGIHSFQGSSIDNRVVEDVETDPVDFHSMEMVPKDLFSITPVVFILAIAFSFVSYWHNSRN